MRKSQREPDAEWAITFVPSSNGERTVPVRTRPMAEAETSFQAEAAVRAARLGISRRAFIRSAAGMATALGIINHVTGCGSDDAPGYRLPNDAGIDDASACRVLAGDDFVVDVQTHHVNPLGAWREDPNALRSVLGFEYVSCGEGVECLGVDHYLTQIFVRSDVAVACLSGIPAEPDKDPLNNDDRVATREIVDRLSGSSRLLVHATVLPDRGPSALDAMQAFAERNKVAAWKVFPSFGGWRFDDERIGIPFLEKARAIGVRLVCAHRGISGDPGGYLDPSSPRDMVKVARDFPDLSFLVYHSGWEAHVPEGPYDPATDNPRGVDRLVRALEEFPTTNVYAELGTTWRSVMTDPIRAGHVLGKLLKACGEDRILFGSDCIWTGSPQEQIAALRAFEISTALTEAHGYPPLTREAKRKILGLNAARVYGIDPAAVRCAITQDDVARRIQDPGAKTSTLRHYGPRTRRELLALQRFGLG